MNDEAAGEVPVAYVVRSPGSIDTTENEIKQFVSRQVTNLSSPSFSFVKRYFFINFFIYIK